METQKRLEKQIQDERKRRGWSQAELGRQCGVQRNQISKIEKDINASSMKLFFNILDVLNLDISLRPSHKDPMDDKKPMSSVDEALDSLPESKRAELKRIAIMKLEEDNKTKKDFMVEPVIKAKMLELYESRNKK